jgi:hypothetical protein
MKNDTGTDLGINHKDGRQIIELLTEAEVLLKPS